MRGQRHHFLGVSEKQTSVEDTSLLTLPSVPKCCFSWRYRRYFAMDSFIGFRTSYGSIGTWLTRNIFVCLGSNRVVLSKGAVIISVYCPFGSLEVSILMIYMYISLRSIWISVSSTWIRDSISMEANVEKDCGVLGNLFQTIVNDLRVSNHKIFMNNFEYITCKFEMSII